MLDEEPTSPTTSADNSGASTGKSNTSSHRNSKLLVIIIVAVLVLASGIAGGVYAYRQYEHSQAVGACVKTVKPLQTALASLHTQQDAKSTTELVKLDVNKLADKTTHNTLVSAVKPVKMSVALCASSLSTSQLQMNTRKNKQAFTRVKTATRNLTTAVDKLVASRTLQSRNLLTAEVKTGQKLVKDSQGKVQEQKTLDQLTTLLTQSDKLTQDKSADYTKLDAQLSELKKAEQAVRDSVEAKRKADEEAARQAEEARQAAAQQAAQQRTYQTPAQRTQAPTQQNNNQNNSANTGMPSLPDFHDDPSYGQPITGNEHFATPEEMCRITGFCS